MAAAFFFAFLILHILRKIRTATKKAPPEAAGAWPFIGHFRLFNGPDLPHLVLGAMAEKYGPIFAIRLGSRRALVVSTSEMVRELFTTHDVAFANRLDTVATEHLTYNHAMFAFSPYGDYWREIRKISMLELLSHHRLSTLNPVLESEMKSAIRAIHKLCEQTKSCTDNVLVDMKKWWGDLGLKLTVTIVAGKRFWDADMASSEGRLRTMRKFMELMGVFTVGDVIPWLRWLDFGGYEKEMRRTATEMDRMLQGWVEEHKRRRISEEQAAERDFIDVMLRIVGSAAISDSGDVEPKVDVDTIIKATCQGIILGAADTMATALTWAIALLLNNPVSLKKAQDELDAQIGPTRQVNVSDLKSLPYHQAIINETLRLYPPAQILGRQAGAACSLGGYDVPAGTRLFINTWKIHHDPLAWVEPDEFRPERFLNVDSRDKSFDFIPFGGGRRVCAGKSFSYWVAQFSLASFLQAFEITAPLGDAVDMTEGFGFTNAKGEPLEVLLAPRLPAELYG